MMGTEIFKIDASWAEKLTKMRVQFLLTPTVSKYKRERNKVSPSLTTGCPPSLANLANKALRYSQYAIPCIENMRT